MKRFILSVLLIASMLTSCALPPETPVTRQQLMRTGIYQKYIIEDSPEQVLDMLNTYGEAILKGKRNIPGKNFPVDLKLLAIPGEVEIIEYDR